MLEIRKLRGYKVRELCANHLWYTCGDSDTYDSMLLACDSCSNVTAYEVECIARDIKEHSVTADTLQDIMSYLVNNCCFSFFE